MIADPLYRNAHWFLTSRIVPVYMTLASTDGLSQKDRNTLLAVPKAISLLPHFDERADISVEVDFSWDDKNWIGRLTYENGALALWQTFLELEGNPPEMCAQWQNTATKLSSQKGLERHDPAHLWVWSDCFRKFAKAFNQPSRTTQGRMVLKSDESSIDMHTLVIQNP